MKDPGPGGQTRAVARRKVDTARYQLEEAGGKTRCADEQKSRQAGRLGEPAIEGGVPVCHVKASGTCGSAGRKKMPLTRRKI